MKKFFSKILIAILILGFFLAPVTPKIDNQNYLSIIKNEIKAQNSNYVYTYEHPLPLIGVVDSPTYTSLSDCDAARTKFINEYEDPLLTLEKDKVGPCKTTDKTTVGQDLDNVADKLSLGDEYGCGITTIFTSCLIKGIYTIFFNLSAFLARYSARLLDYFAFYSIDSNSYRGKAIIDQGWTVVRDVANLFFIIALLYVAGKTVLGLNSSDNKKVIAAVVVMALLINFSLFFTKIVIDSSNILARVFYANIESKSANGQALPASYDNEKSISIGLVDIFDPQELFLNNNISIEDNLGPFAIVLILSIILMFYMTYMFFSISFVFLGRVIMLWILMIFSPIAFASYNTGIKIPGFGHKEWWDQLFNQAFLAPIFVFFLYIIISFKEGISFVDLQSTTDATQLGNIGSNASYATLDTIMKVSIPFLIIFFLVKKAKDITIKMSGDIGKGLSNWGTIVGGAALGLGAAGVAMAGRQTMGAVAKYAQNNNVRDKDRAVGDRLAEQSSKSGFARINPFSYGKIIGKGLAANVAQGVRMLPTLSKSQGKFLTVGETIEKSKKDAKDFTHAQHALDHGAQEVMHDKEAKYSELAEHEQEKVREAVNRDELAKKIYGVEFNKLQNDGTKAQIKNLVETYHKNGENGPLTTNIGGQSYTLGHTAKDMSADLNNKTLGGSAAINEFVNALRKGSYDIRNLPDSKFNNGKGLLGSVSKNSVFLAATIATGLRMGLKDISKVDTGKPQKDFLKDLNTTISSSLKGMMKDMKLSSGGGSSGGDHGGGHDSHGSSGGDHGGGGGHH